MSHNGREPDKKKLHYWDNFTNLPTLYSSFFLYPHPNLAHVLSLTTPPYSLCVVLSPNIVLIRSGCQTLQGERPAPFPCSSDAQRYFVLTESRNTPTSVPHHILSVLWIHPGITSLTTSDFTSTFAIQSTCNLEILGYSCPGVSFRSFDFVEAEEVPKTS